MNGAEKGYVVEQAKVAGYRDRLDELHQVRGKMIAELRGVCQQIADEEMRVAMVEVLDR